MANAEVCIVDKKGERNLRSSIAENIEEVLGAVEGSVLKQDT